MEAVQVVRDLLASPDVSPVIRLKAAFTLIHSVGAITPEVIGPTDPEDAEAVAKRRDFIRTIARLDP